VPSIARSNRIGRNARGATTVLEMPAGWRREPEAAIEHAIEKWKPEQQLRGIQRQRQSANSLMLEGLGWRPKKRARPPPYAGLRAGLGHRNIQNTVRHKGRRTEGAREYVRLHPASIGSAHSVALLQCWRNRRP
jgi:hypothetical protein